MTDGPRLPPANGRPAKSLVLLLHGYGADADDLIDIGRAWAPLLPSTTFSSLSAPERLPGAPFGRQWFALQRRDAEELRSGVVGARGALQRTIATEMKRVGVAAGKTALVGFSQGTMMALDAALTFPERFAAVVGYSGLLADPSAASAAKRDTVPPILLVHGDRDDVIPARALLAASGALAEAGFPVEWHLSEGLGHGIGPDGLEIGARFLKRALDA